MKIRLQARITLIQLALVFSCILLFSIIVYSIISSILKTEAADKLSVASELKTQTIISFLEDRYGDIHVMTGTEIIKEHAAGLIRDIENSSIDPDLSINEKRKILADISGHYRFLKQYIDKYTFALKTFAEIKFVAIYPVSNRNGDIIFDIGDQLISANEFDGNTKERGMFKGGYELIANNKEGVETEKYHCPFLYSSSIEHCSELNKTSIHMSHGISLPGLTMEQQRGKTRVPERFSTMLIFDVNTGTLDELLQTTSGMGETGESYIVEQTGDHITMLTDSRFEEGTALHKNLDGIKGIEEHLNRGEHRRGTDICLNTIYTNYEGNEVLSHNHMIYIGQNEAGLITEIETSEVFAAVRIILITISIIAIGIFAATIIISFFVSRSIADPLKTGVVFSENVAEGDLTQKLPEKILNRHDEIGDLGRAMKKMSDELNHTVNAILLAAKNLLTAVQEISSGNENLSQRTTEQSATLEEIASTVEQATATINHNADTATSSDDFSRKTLDLAIEGGKTVSDAVSAINEINRASDKIGEIITVIDEIAFQTNLLALNAAVEAARAGEQGRGFAVVAGEVRNLAQRSGNAAKEIGSLIKETVAKVNQGTELANTSGDTIREIISAMKELSVRISEISNATVEQKQGMEQISDTVTQLDSMTQQNASMAEETAAASEEMSLQANELMLMMERFRIE